MRTGTAVCLVSTAAVLTAIIGTPIALKKRCETHPEGTKATSRQSADTFEIKCPIELSPNGDVIAGTVPRGKIGHIFPNGTAIDNDGFFKGKAKEDGTIYLSYPGIDNIDDYINAIEGKNSSSNTDFGVRATGLVDAKGDIWKDTAIFTKTGKYSSTYDHTEPKKIARLEIKSDKATQVEKNALGIFHL